MDQTIQTPAPTPTPAPAAPAAAPAPVSASVDALNKNDFTAFQDAEGAKRAGKPLSDVAAAPATQTPATEPPPAATEPAQPPALSKRQQDANDRTRRAVEQATADLQARIRELEGRAQPAQPPTPKEPEWRRYAAMPDAPKVDDFERIEDHTAAMSHFIATTMLQERAQNAQHQQHESQRQRFLTERGEKFSTKLQEAAAADPDFLDKIPPAVATARPLSGLTSEERQSATFANVAAEAAFRSEHPHVLLTYLHAHQDEVVAIASQPPSEWLPALIHLDGRLSGPLTHPAAPAAPAPASSASPSPISAAPPPAPELRRTGASVDPKQAALDRGDFSTFQDLSRAERQAKRVSA